MHKLKPEENSNREYLKNQKYYYNDEELNNLNYENAIKYDKRTYFEYYCSLLKLKHLIFFTFISNIDYNIFTIKLTLFIFSFSLYFAVNAIFFEDDTMHKIYESQGNLNFFFHLLHILYSTIISSIITIIVKSLALSNKSMLKIKQIRNTNKSLKESVKLKRFLKFKFIIYFIICFIFLIFFWYFISAFCAVYNNTQSLLFQNTLVSFILSLCYPLALNLLPGIFRIPALRARNKNQKCLYKVSNFLSLF